MPDTVKRMIERAMELGADLAGIAGIEHAGNHVSALIIAVSHPEDRPELDYWSNIEGGTQGNRILIDINNKLSSWIHETFDIQTQPLPYHVESGGIFLKDAAVMAGLGCFGRNNLLVTPAFGPRIRLRGLLIEANLTSTGPVEFDPCENCEGFCRQACPQNAFERQVLNPYITRQNHLPARDGRFSRTRCQIQMGRDIEAARPVDDRDDAIGSSSIRAIKYCRRCETACPWPSS
jgi:epoxyqueuosine reductase